MKQSVLLLITGMLFIACTDQLPFDGQELQHTQDNILDPYKMTRAVAVNLILSHGVGYGYNGVDGEECNVPDVRSQVLDPNAILKDSITAFFYNISGNEFQFTSKTGFSLNELLEKIYFGGGASAELAVVFKGSVRGTLQLYNHKKISSFYCTAHAYKNAFHSYIDAPSVTGVIKDHPEYLTKNFRSAIKRLGPDPTKMQMDSLIARYGTHVVTECTLGGMVELDVRLEKDSVATISQQNAIGEVALMSLFKYDGQSSSDEYDLKIINSGDSRLTVRGGDSRKLEQTIMNFDWGRDAVKSEDINDWLASIGTDEENRQSLEMTSMEMTPIWEFIPDEYVAEKLEAHITGNAKLMLDLYGYQNFVNTSFPACPAAITDDKWFIADAQDRIIQTSTECMCYNIEAGGRYVATLCYENIPAIDPYKPVWVAYPIYQQQVNISTGLCIHNGKAYRVGWQFGEMVVTPIQAKGMDGNIYMTGGYLYPIPTQEIDYEQSHVITGYEWPGSIKTDGTLDTTKPLYTVYKENDRFLLRHYEGQEQSGKIKALPNWSYDGNLNRMVRNSSYNYYYNPYEVDYIKKMPASPSDRIIINKSGWLSGTIDKPVYIAEDIDITLRNADIKNKIIIDAPNVTLTLCNSEIDDHIIVTAERSTINLENATIRGQINCQSGNTTINLKAGTLNQVFPLEDGLSSIRVVEWLHIKGDGELFAHGGDGAAGIGGNLNDTETEDCVLIIEGGNIDAYGGYGGAGIGAGMGKSGIGNLLIRNSNLFVMGGEGASGIGSGADGSICKLVSITNSTVDSFGKDGGAAIGSGARNSETKQININTSRINAHGSSGAAGIGSGAFKSKCGNISISEANVDAMGDDGGAGIGSGIDASLCGSIELYKSEIQAQSYDGGAGIGGGKAGVCGAIICSESNIESHSREDGAGIGSGSYGSICGDIRIQSSNIETIASFEAAAIGSGYESSSCGNIHIGPVQDGANPTSIKRYGSDVIGAGENSSCGDVIIHPETNIIF